MTHTLTIAEALIRGAQQLAAAGIDDAPAEARALLRHILSASAADIYLRSKESLDPAAWERYAALLHRRALREPLAYIVGTIEFYGLELHVDPRVLIPRPETELLVDAALGWLRDTGKSGVVAADVGTGSGCIAVTMTVTTPVIRRLYAIDLSQGALAVAKENAERHGVSERIAFLPGDLLAPLPEPADLILANLPYVPTPDLGALMPEVRDYEPRTALEGGTDGLDLVRRLLSAAPARLKPGGALFFEIGLGQGDAVLVIAGERFPTARTGILPDLAGIPRVAYILLPNH